MSHRGEESYPEDDPRRIRSVAVTTDDVVSALEANIRRDVGAVLRVTPPFHPRERARLHVTGEEGDYGDVEPLHLDPTDLVSDAPAYPTPDDTEDELRSEGEYTTDRHRDRHVEAVEGWRRTVADALRSEIAVPSPGDDHIVDVKALG
jgi:hypothetical protein